ncbi:hypothetical protein EVG20_g1175 [Dentipellis fragilis]|uniref:Transcription initiation factor TFIID subunit 2 n=1 Tax=Dentipellis fragilis TaxID=205917 RepID=A0A4Y9ZAF4_9AGAM|nr:hypothetical protein EVG20_g1175 [Dentipellis fragilis]
MQREHNRRGFSLYVFPFFIPKVVLEIDFSGSIWGYTEITIVPTSNELRTINLHCRQCTIHNVTVASHRADFIHNDALANLNISAPQDVHTHPELKRKLYSALAENDDGELSIAIPKEVPLKQSGNSLGGIASEAATPEPQTPGFVASQPLVAMPEFSPITINIEYSLRNPADGLQFVLPTDAYPYRVPHVYTTPSCPDAARCWVPCLDNLWERCTWDFEFVVQRYLEERDPDEYEEAQDEHPTVVVCSGDLVEQVAHPFNSNKSIFVFSQTTPTSVQHIGFVAGPLHVLPLPSEAVIGDEAGGSSQPQMHAFCSPGHEAQLPPSVLFTRQAMTFYSTEFGSYPFGSHKFVFVDELPTLRFDTSTLSIVSVDLLHGEDAIDQVYETRQALSHALACQWIGINIQPKVWSDLWLVNGLGLYIAGLFLRKLFGNNEYRFRLKKDMDRVLEWDHGSMPPICQPQLLDPPESAFLPFINLKSPLVLHILDRRLGKSGTSLGLSRVLPKLFLSAISGEMPHNALSTHTFLRTCRKVSGVDLRSFAEQWIYGSGCPAFGFSATFNRKKMAVEITMRQDAPAHKAHEHDEVVKTLLKPVPFFEGQMTIRIHEADGTPYEHVLDIRAPFKRYEVPFNTKYKRVRRNTKRYLARQAAAQAAAEGDAEAAEAMGMVDMGFGLEVWEKEKERENWKVVDWTEEDEQVMSGATYEWIRMDADFEWIAAIAFDQPDFMWVSQLQRDRDVVAQLEAVNALTKMPNAIISSTLTKTVLVTNYFFRVRCEAALALVTCALRRLDFLGLFHLFKLFLRYCYEPDDSQQDLFTHTYVPRPNDFSDVAEYFVRRALVKAIAQVRFENGKCPSVVRQFLTDQLKYNDNTANPYTDAFYICTIISSLACASVSTVPPERGELFPMEAKNEQTSEDAGLLRQALDEVDRYRNMDRLIPSPHNVVTVAALEFRLILSIANLIPNDPRVFFPMTREGNYTQVRIAAFDALFLTKWYTPKIMSYILAVMAHDPSRVIRRHVARTACQSLGLLVTMGELKNSVKESEALLIEEDGNMQEKAKENKKSEVDLMIKALRKDKEIGKNEVVREFLLPIALAPDADTEVRWAVLKLADILIREVPPPTPVLKIPLKARATKPLIPSSAAPKVRLVPSAVSTPVEITAPKPLPIIDTEPGVPLAVTVQRKAVAFQPQAPKAKVKPPKPNHARHVPKAQSGGMGAFDLRACRNAVQKLKTHKNALLFLQPVDPVRDRAPNYFEYIRNPMDLSTMGAKLEEGMYKDRFAFEADFRLMIRNAKTYNAPNTYAYNESLALESFFDKQWTRINKTLDSKAATQPKPPKPMAPPPVPMATQAIASSSKPTAPSAPISEVTLRTSIKLKLGSGATPRPAVPAPPRPAETSSKASAIPRPKPKKPKITEMPPPPIDDGSIDLLEEVIAIERQKERENGTRKQHSPVTKAEEGPKAKTSAIVPVKRKKGADFDDVTEDEILALATPSKKLSRPPPPPLPEKELKEKSPPKPSVSVKLKRTGESSSTSKTPTPAPSPAPRASVKGKEKEVAPVHTPAPARPPKKSPNPQPTPINKTKCKEIIRVLLRLPEAGIFSRPVNPTLDGCPTYYDEIKSPMDFGTMSNKLNANSYATMEEFVKDVEQIFINCRQFNPPTTYPCQCADAVERAFKKEWAKVTERKLAWHEKRGLQSIMTNFVKDPLSFVFREPVDPVVLNIPTYFDVIPRKDARDLRTIRQKLDADKYDSVEAWEADIDLMIRNAIKFNGADSEVGKIAIMVKNRLKELISAFKSQQGKKRKESEKPNGTQPASKKAKMG